MTYTDSIQATAKAVPKGDYILRKADANKVYQAVGYCRLNKAYEFNDVNDISRSIYIKGTKPVFTGFTY
jgi:hypothetical protein